MGKYDLCGIRQETSAGRDGAAGIWKPQSHSSPFDSGDIKAKEICWNGHSGVNVFGGSRFLNDAANYLDGLIHGMDPDWWRLAIWRWKKN
jgi:hypothetical protein